MIIKELLKQYTDIVAEIKELRRKITNLEQKEIGIVHDSVKGSGGFPYNIRPFKIVGYDYVGAENKKRRLEKYNNILKDRLNTCEDLKLQIEEFINDIPDSRTRRVFQYRYIDGMEWLPIAMRMNRVHESYPRKIHDRYLEGME